MSKFFSLEAHIDWIEGEAHNASSRFDMFSVDYVRSHEARYRKTLDLIERIGPIDKAIEIGATDFFQVYLGNNLGVAKPWATIYSNNIEEKFYSKSFNSAGFGVESQVVSINIESEMLPVHGGEFDLVLFCEVLEHLDVDPMFCLIEINRILKDDGWLVLTTPNSCSARIAYKACLGYRPHFYMQYEKDRSPYKHNFEYDSRSLLELLKCAGFTVEAFESHDVFEPTWKEAVDFLRRNGFPMDNRGDDFFVLARKTGPYVERWPDSLYV